MKGKFLILLTIHGTVTLVTNTITNAVSVPEPAATTLGLFEVHPSHRSVSAVATDRKSAAIPARREDLMASLPLSLPVTMSVTGVSHCPDNSEWVCCLECGKHLGLVQPETQEPERLVGTCGNCGNWYLLDWHPGSRKGLMVLLPGHEELLHGFQRLTG